MLFGFEELSYTQGAYNYPMKNKKTKNKGLRFPNSDFRRSHRRSASRYLLAISLLIAVLTIFPYPASADPHAMFYTDRAQEQLFYNVLAALNQADYVEAPSTGTSQTQLQGQPTSPPQIESDVRIGNYYATGTYAPQNSNRQARFDENGNVVVGPNGNAEPLEPLERTNLPRIAVRQVTSDNGDVFFRESVERRALAERIRVELAHFQCRILVDIYGPKAITDAPQNQSGNNDKNKNPCDEYLKAEKNT